MTRPTLYALALLPFTLLAALNVRAAEPAAGVDAVMAALSATLDNLAGQSKGKDDAPYFTSLALTDEQSTVLQGTNGTWAGAQHTHPRTDEACSNGRYAASSRWPPSSRATP